MARKHYIDCKDSATAIAKVVRLGESDSSIDYWYDYVTYYGTLEGAIKDAEECQTIVGTWRLDYYGLYVKEKGKWVKKEPPEEVNSKG